MEISVTNSRESECVSVSEKIREGEEVLYIKGDNRVSSDSYSKSRKEI